MQNLCIKCKTKDHSEIVLYTWVDTYIYNYMQSQKSLETLSVVAYVLTLIAM